LCKMYRMGNFDFLRIFRWIGRLWWILLFFIFEICERGEFGAKTRYQIIPERSFEDKEDVSKMRATALTSPRPGTGHNEITFHELNPPPSIVLYL
jgi:hypothetical protein